LQPTLCFYLFSANVHGKIKIIFDSGTKSVNSLRKNGFDYPHSESKKLIEKKFLGHSNHEKNEKHRFTNMLELKNKIRTNNFKPFLMPLHSKKRQTCLRGLQLLFRVERVAQTVVCNVFAEIHVRTSHTFVLTTADIQRHLAKNTRHSRRRQKTWKLQFSDRSTQQIFNEIRIRSDNSKFPREKIM